MVGTEFKMFVSLFLLNSMRESKLCNLLESAKLSPNLDWGGPKCAKRSLKRGAERFAAVNSIRYSSKVCDKYKHKYTHKIHTNNHMA